MPEQGSGAKQRLLESAMRHITDRGISDLSLRELAGALGTSHRMLVYHFGSKEGLLVAVIRAVEQQQRDSMARLGDIAGLSPMEQGWRLWKHLSDPSLWPHERLFFEVYGMALQGRPGTTALLDGIVDSWIGPLTELNMAHGLPHEQARASARLGVAVCRGLLLDLLATGDRAGVDEAMAFFATLVETAAASPSVTAPELGNWNV